MQDVEPLKRPATDDIGEQQKMYAQMHANARHQNALKQREEDNARMVGAQGQNLQHSRQIKDVQAEDKRNQEAALRTLTHERDVLRNARGIAGSSSHYPKPESVASTVRYPIVQHGRGSDRSRSPPALPIAHEEHAQASGAASHGAEMSDSETLKPFHKGQRTSHSNKAFQGRAHFVHQPFQGKAHRIV
jgi:hypothetical protein